jgi:hypothetical protein
VSSVNLQKGDALRNDARSVVGYHGTRIDRAEAAIASGEFLPSENDYDWLGHGVYFWEFAPGRAWQWAQAKYGNEAAVITAQIELGYCLDLSDVHYTQALQDAYDGLREAYIRTGATLPANKGKAHCLDCLVINYVTKYLLPECETVRAAFLEGDPIYSGSRLLSQSHIQLVVRDQARIRSGFKMIPKEA